MGRVRRLSKKSLQAFSNSHKALKAVVMKQKPNVVEVVTVKSGAKTKIIKKIKVDIDKCIGCRACEMVCSGFHAKPKYSSINPARSRIRMVVDELKDIYVPIRATDYTKSECAGRHDYTIGGKEYTECSFCGSVCPARDYFIEPDSGLPLRCDMCEDDPTLKEPMCVQVCSVGALTYEEEEVEVKEQEVKPGDMEVGLESLVDKFGMQKVLETVARMAKKG